MTTDDDTPRSPFASDYAVNQPPRLSILHFLGITACVASYLGTLQTVRSLDPGFERYLPIMSVFSIASGASLFGLILLVARRWRGTSFPIYPGEYLLVVQAVGALLYPFMLLAVVISGNYSSWIFLQFVFAAIFSGLHYWAAVQTRNRPWKIFFSVCIAGDVLSLLAQCGGLFDYRVQHVAEVFLIFALLRDRQQGRRYPWTHWFGVGVQLWYVIVNVGWEVWMSMVQ